MQLGLAEAGENKLPSTTPHLIELEDIEQLKQLAVLLVVLQLGIVLLQAVQCQFGVIVHIHFHRLKGSD